MYCHICSRPFASELDLNNHWGLCHFDLCTKCIPSHDIRDVCYSPSENAAASGSKQPQQPLVECSGTLKRPLALTELPLAKCQRVEELSEERHLVENNGSPPQREFLRTDENGQSEGVCDVRRNDESVQTAETSNTFSDIGDGWLFETARPIEHEDQFDIIDHHALRECSCPMCDEFYENRDLLEQHFLNFHPEFYNNFIPNQKGGGASSKFNIREKLNSHRGAVRTYEVDMTDNEIINVEEFFDCIRGPCIDILTTEQASRKNYKLFFSLKIRFVKHNPDGVESEVVAAFTSFAHCVLHPSMIPRTFHLIFQTLDSQVEAYTGAKSGLTIEEIQKCEFVVSTYHPTRGGSYIELPYPLSEKLCCLLNIDNHQRTIDGEELKCFVWSVLAHKDFGGADLIKNPNRSRIDKKVKTYRSHMSKLNLKGIKFPMTVEQIPKFERLNPTISFTVIGYDMGDVPVFDQQRSGKQKTRRIGKKTDQETMEEFRMMEKNTTLIYNTEGGKKTTHVDLLLLMNGDNSHFALIRDLCSFLKRPDHGGMKKICRNCLNCFRSKRTLEEHVKFCAALGLQKTTYPQPASKIEFCNFERMVEVPFRIYADFESLLPVYNIEDPSEMKRKMKNKSNMTGTTRLNTHKPCGYSFVVVDFEGKRRMGSHYVIEHEDEDPTERFLKEIIETVEVLTYELKAYQMDANKNIVITNEQLEAAKLLNLCCFCEKDLFDDETPHRHHNHLPPYNFIGLAHSSCNMKAEMKIEFPIFLHNFGSYDVHFIVQALGKLTESGLVQSAEPIARTSEKFLSLTINKNIKFLDSLQFTLSSLDRLVETMAKDGTDPFKITKAEFEHDAEAGADVNLLFKKGAYPYSLMKSCEDFKRTQLPPKEDFYNDLAEEAIKDHVYEHAQKVWESFKIESMKEWHNLYVRLDTALLSDVMENTRSIMMKSYGLDIAHYYSLPMVAFDAVKKMSKVRMDPIIDPTMHCWMESGIRGGYVSTGSLRAVSANNKYMQKEYDPSKESTYISYIDANNLCKCTHSLSFSVNNSHLLPLSFLN